MALKPTIYKIQIELADSDRGCYDTMALTLARHPSETLQRMAARILAYCLHSTRGLVFTRGLSTADEPALWQLDDSGDIQQWIEVGQPEEPRLRKACGRARAVRVYAFGKSADTWWKLQGEAISGLDAVEVWQLDWQAVDAMAGLLERSTALNVSIVGGTIYLDSAGTSLSVEPALLFRGAKL